MKSSLSSREADEAVAELARERQPARPALPCDLLLRRAARLARPRGQDDPRDDRLGDADVRVQPVLERGTDLRIDRRHDLGIVQPILRLPLKLRLLHEHAEDGDEALANVLGRERHALRRKVVRVDEIANGLAQAGAEAVLVRAARSRGDAVHVAAHVLVGRLRPLQREIQPEPGLVALLRHGERRVVHGRRGSLREDFLQVVRQPFGVLIDDFRALGLVLEDNLHAFVQVARHLEPLPDDRRVELDLRKDRRIGAEEHGRSAASRGARLLQRADHRPLLEPHLPLRAVAPYGGDELLRQRVDDAGADAVQAARGLVVAGLEFSAGVQRRKDHLERALLRLRMLVDRNAAAVVGDRDRAAVAVERDGDVRGVAVHRLVDRVVEDFPDKVVEAGAADAADVHAGPLANRLQPFEDGDVFRCVRGRHSGQLIVSKDVSTRGQRVRHSCCGAPASPHTIRCMGGRLTIGRIAACAAIVALCAAAVDAQFRRGRFFEPVRSPTPTSFDGSFNFCRVMFSARRRRLRRQLVRRLSPRRRQPLHPLLGADEGTHQRRSDGRTESPRARA